jgi:predicted PurR-regulated permease PerM
LERHVRLHRRLHLVVVYLVFISAVVAILSVVMPRMAVETKIFVEQVPKSLETLHRRLDALSQSQSYIAPLIQGVKETLTVGYLMGTNREGLISIGLRTLNQITHYVTYFFLGTLFSFLILFDLPNLRNRTRALSDTRFREIYAETADSVAKFAMVVGAAFQAQILIAVLNTFLTALGLWYFQIQPIALLSVIVFFAGLIPVLGVFISSVPILLLAFNIQGWMLALKAAGMILVVHAVEAYVLNPNIVSAILKINPVLTLIILYLGHSLFGFWGVLLGVPVTVYVYRYILLAESCHTVDPQNPRETPSICK